MSGASSRLQSGGKSANASRNAAWRSAVALARVPTRPSRPCRRGCSWPLASVYPAACGRRAARKALAHSREVVVASQPRWWWPARQERGWVADSVKLVYQPQPDSLADVLGVGAPSRYRRQMDQTSGAYRSTGRSQAC